MPLLFQDAAPASATSANRADAVCFVGFVRRRAGAALSAGVKTWLQDQGWRPRGTPVADDDALLHTPVPLESFEAFDRLFAWENRPTAPQGFPFTTWLGAAVRSFFRQGGARCFVVRAGDPEPYLVLPKNASPEEGAAHLARQRIRLGALLPGLAGTGTTPAERPAPSTWRGLGVLLGLEEAAFVCLPDLPELVADATLEPAGLAPLPPSPEVFVTCTPSLPALADEIRQVSSSPACTETGYARWRQAVRHVGLFLRAQRRDVEFVTALPLPSPDLATRYSSDLDAPSHVLGLGRSIDDPDGTASAFVQACHPWLGTPGAEALPGGIEPPDGVFAGALARSIPQLGVAHSIGRQPLHGVHAFLPELERSDLLLDTPRGASPALIHRVSLLGPTPDGPQVLSDVTTSSATAHRPACVGRLVAALLRTARQVGDSVTFEPSGEELWATIRAQLERLLNQFFAAGALHGESAAAAYSIRCDATTTTQNDLDNGRVIAEVRVAPAHPVGLIVVTLSLREGAVTVVDPAA